MRNHKTVSPVESNQSLPVHPLTSAIDNFLVGGFTVEEAIEDLDMTAEEFYMEVSKVQQTRNKKGKGFMTLGQAINKAVAEQNAAKQPELVLEVEKIEHLIKIEDKKRLGRKSISEEVKAEILELYSSDVPIADIVAHYGVSKSSIFVWAKQEKIRKGEAEKRPNTFHSKAAKTLSERAEFDFSSEDFTIEEGFFVVRIPRDQVLKALLKSI